MLDFSLFFKVRPQIFFMKAKNHLTQSIISSSIFVALLWSIKTLELSFHLNLNIFGVVPNTLEGLLGIVTAPLVHGSLSHLFSNTLPLLLLGSVLLYGYPNTRKYALIIIWFISGLGVWLFARDANHIGASGITHGIFFYLLLSSIARRDKQSIALMMIAFFMYGGMVLTVLPQEPGISFEYHFFGAVGGVIATLVLYRLEPKPVEKKYDWEGSEEDDPEIGELWREDVNSDQIQEQSDERQ